MASLRLLCDDLGGFVDIRPGHDLELRTDILRVRGQGGYATLGWTDGGIAAGYCVFLNSREVALVKYRFDRQVLSPFFWDPLAVTNRPVTLFLRFRMTESTLSLQTQVVDLENPGIVIFEKTVEDTSASDPVAGTSPPLQASTPDPGPAWPTLQRWGVPHLSLFGATTNRGGTRLEMEVDNFGLRQTLEVRAEDCVACTYTNAGGARLPYRLFVPTNQQPGALYRLVLHLHGGWGVGEDNVHQFAEPGAPVFVRPDNQARHPCFLVAPQVPTAVAQTYPNLCWWALRDRVIGLLKVVQAQYPIDPDRIYVTGESLGGVGTWTFAAGYPELFAAAVPVAGFGVSEQMQGLVTLPIWAFHGSEDQIDAPDLVMEYFSDAMGRMITAKGSRALVADLRHVGACPIYTEYVADHGMFGEAYEKPGLLDWLMAQRRGRRVQQPPWMAVTAPASNGVWITSCTNLDLAGTACADAGITNAAWKNETTSRTGSATGTTNWVATGIPLRLGSLVGARVLSSSNVVTVRATGGCGSALYAGTTTFNTALQVVQVPLCLRAKIAGDQLHLEWSGTAQSFVVQRRDDLGRGDWVEVTRTSATNLALPHSGDRGFYRVVVQ
jgi:dienelactone hydrolase